MQLKQLQFKKNKAKIELLSFSSSKLLLRLFYNKNGISGSFTFYNTKLAYHLYYINLALLWLCPVVVV